MKRTSILVLVIAFLLAAVLSGCSGGGISQDAYDAVMGQVTEWQTRANELQDKVAEAEAAKQSIEEALKNAEADIARLNGTVSDMQITGATAAETAEKINKTYNETHTYTVQDLFVCSDMAAEVWNMLQAQGIESVIMIGSLEASLSDITQCTHAWVLAEVGPGEYLALETTVGKVVRQSEDQHYYQGWSFTSPKDLKEYQRLVREYNLRVGVINWLSAQNQANIDSYNAEAAEHSRMVDEYNSRYASNPTSTAAQVYMAQLEAHETLLDEKLSKKQLIEALMREQKDLGAQNLTEINSLATRV